jgi:2'-5' RNA ligase
MSTTAVPLDELEQQSSTQASSVSLDDLDAQANPISLQPMKPTTDSSGNLHTISSDKSDDQIYKEFQGVQPLPSLTREQAGEELRKTTMGTEFGSRPALADQAVAAAFRQPSYPPQTFQEKQALEREAMAPENRAQTARIARQAAPGPSMSTDLQATPEERIRRGQYWTNPRTGQRVALPDVPEAEMSMFDPAQIGLLGPEEIVGGTGEVQEAEEQRKVAPGAFYTNPRTGQRAPVTYLPDEAARQELGGAAEAIGGAGKVGSVVLPGAAMARPLGTALSLGAGYASSELAGAAAHKAGLSPEAEEFVRQVFFLAPTAAGIVSGLRTGTIETPQGRFNVASVFGGRVKAAVGSTETAHIGRVQVGETIAGVTIPRTGALPPASDAAKALGDFEQHSGNPDFQPPPPPPAPPGANGPEHLTHDIVRSVSDLIQQAPPEARPQLMLESHQNMVKWMMGRGTFIGPDHKLYTVDNVGQAKKLASTFINDEVDRIDKARKEAAKAAEAAKETPVASPKTAAKPKPTTQPPTAVQTPQPSQPAAAAAQPSGKAGEIATAFSRENLKGAVSEGFIDSAWKRAQAGQDMPFSERQGSIENRLAEARRAGRLNSREDVAAIVRRQPSATGVPPMGREMTTDAPAVHKVEAEAQTAPGQKPLVMVKKETPADTAALAQPPAPVAPPDVRKIGEEDKESGRTIVQPSNDEIENERLAAQAAPELTTQLSQIASSVPGAIFHAPLGRVRPQKSLERIGEKVDDDGKPARTVQDYLAAQVAADTPEAKNQLIAELKKQFQVIDVEDKFIEGREDLAGYPSANVQVQMSNGLTAEIQIVPREVQEITDVSHRHYSDGRKAELAGDLAARDKAHAEAARINKAALDKFKERNGIEEGRFEKGSTQINVDPQSEVGQAHAAAVAAIPEEHLMPTDFGGNPKGREDQPHVTVRYGLKYDSPEAIEKIKEAASQIQPFEVPIGKTDTFPPSEHSDGAVPVIARLETTPELVALRKAMEAAGEFHKDTFPEYKPHITLAYVKPEVADQYKGGNQLEGQKVPVDHIVVSKRDGSQEVIQLGGGQAAGKSVPLDELETGPRVAHSVPLEELERPVERRARPRDVTIDNSRIQEFRQELATETNPEKRAELEAAIEREKSILASRTPTRAMAAPRQVGPAPGKSGEVNPQELTFDPKLFQYKLNVNEKGVTNLLAGRKWNPDLAGIVSVWRDPADGKLYVINGHHRAQLALDNGVDNLLVRNLKVNDASEARAIGALQNIAEGRGTAVDAAKFFRERGITPADLDKHGISMGEATALNGLALSKLDPSVFEKVATGQMTEGRGVAIGQATDDPAQQEAIVKLIDKQEAKGRKITNDTVAELARFVAQSGNRTVEQGGLFGANQEIHSLALEKAEISAYIKQQLAKERRVFGAVSSEGKAAALGQVEGQKIKAGENLKISQRAAQAAEAYNKLTSYSGPVNDALEKAARELVSGNHKPEDVKTRAYAAIRVQLRATLAGGQGAGAERVQQAPGRAAGNEEALHSLEAVKQPAPTFFSKAEKTVEDKLPRNVAAQSIIPTLRNAGVKEEELKWLGLDDWVKDKKLVSKQSLLDFIRQNNVQVDEVTKGGEPENLSFLEGKTRGGTPEWVSNEGAYDYYIRQDGPYNFHAEQTNTRTGIKVDEKFQTFNAANRWLNGLRKERAVGTKFSNYQIPGGENYRELLLTLPGQGTPARDAFEAFKTEMQNKYLTGGQWRQKLSPSEEVEVSRLMRAATEELAKTPDFRSGHFDESNVIAHIRFNDRVDADGKKVLFLEELQSDWHQKGRKEGYRGTAIRPEDLRVENGQLVSPDGQRAPLPTNWETSPNQQGFREAWAREFTSHRATGGVSNAPFKNTWHELALKRMLRYAAENDYDRLGWTTGEQQAERYDLSKHVKEVQWNATSHTLRARDLNGKEVIAKPDVPPERLADYIGKEVAQRLIDSKPIDDLDTRKLSGLDLKVGGAGMKGFYDKILPDFLNRYGKKWGAKVGETSIKVGTEGTFAVEEPRPGQFIVRDRGTGEIADEGFDDRHDAQSMADSMNHLGKDFTTVQAVHSTDITDSMRDSVVYEGQPLFNLSNDDLANWARDAGGRIKIEELGDQGNIFGGAEKMYRLSTSKQNSVAVTDSQLRSLAATVPALARKLGITPSTAKQESSVRFEYQPPEAASLFTGQKPPVLTISASARDLIMKAADTPRFNASNLSIQQARKISGALRDMEAGELPAEVSMGQVRDLADALLQASKDAGNSGITIHKEGAPEAAIHEEAVHAGQRQLGRGEVGQHLSDEAIDRVLAHPASEKLGQVLRIQGYSAEMPKVYQVAEMAAKIATGQHSLTKEEAAGWFENYVDELHKEHDEGNVAAAFANMYDGARELYEQARRTAQGRAARPGGSESGLQPSARNLPESATGPPQKEAGRGNRENAPGKAAQGELDQPFLLSREQSPTKGKPSERGAARMDILGAPVEAAKRSISDYLSNRRERQHYTAQARELEQGIAGLEHKYDADVLSTRNMLRSVNKAFSPKEQESVYHAVESGRSAGLTDQEKILKSEFVEPIKNMNQALHEELTGYGWGELYPDTGYIHRIVQGKPGRLESAAKGEGGGKGNILSKATPSTKQRSMFALEHADGHRMVVHKEAGRVTAFDAGKAVEVGTYKGGLQPGGKFTDKDGQDWTLQQATTKEIEEATDLRYYKNAMAVTALDNLELQRAVDAARFLEGFKNRPEFSSVAIKADSGEPIPKGWKQSQVPQFRGYAFEPRTREVLDEFYDRLANYQPPGFLEKIGDFLQTSVLLNPLMHVANMADIWATERGALRMAQIWKGDNSLRAGMRALRAVTTRNDDYLEALRQGAPMMSHKLLVRDLNRAFQDVLAGEVANDSGLGAKVREAMALPLGLNPVEAIRGASHAGAFMSNDIFVLQSVYDKMETSGMSFQQALRQTMRTFPEYRVPTRVADQKWLADLMKNRLMTWFSGYHYGKWKAFRNMAADSVRPGASPEDRTWALSRLAMLGLLVAVVYPALQEAAKRLSGDKNAHVKRFGLSSTIQNVIDVGEGKKSPTMALESELTPSALIRAGAEIATNQDYRRNYVYDPTAPAATKLRQIGQHVVKNAVGPVSQYERYKNDPAAMKKWLWSQVGVTFPKTESETKAEILMNNIRREHYAPRTPEEQDEFEAKMDRIAKGKMTLQERRHQIDNLLKNQFEVGMREFSYAEAKQVYDVGTSREKALMARLMLEKRFKGTRLRAGQ